MKRGLGVFVFLSLILILSLTFVSADFFSDIFGKITGKVTSVDLTPRIAYWSGKVNQHTENGVWKTDPDGTSGANIDKLTYCKKWYPDSVSFKAYSMEAINTWRDAGNTGLYTSTKQSYECIQPSDLIESEISYPSPFIVNGAADVAIIYGEKDNSLVIVQAGNIQNDLQSRVNGLGELLVKDSNLDLVKNKNLIIIGTCDNTIVYNLTKGNCSSSFIKSYYSPYSSGKKILLIAGPDASTIVNLVRDYLGKYKVGEKPSCNDSDGGKNYYIKGKVVYKYGSLSTIPNDMATVSDFCSGNSINEAFCFVDANGTAQFGWDGIVCPNGCVNGACVKTVNTTATYYPAPFVVNGIVDVAIIYGTQTGVSSLELVQAGNIQDDLYERMNGALGDTLVRDSETSLVSTKNWIVVGTPCSNSAIYKSLGLIDCTLVTEKLGIGPGQAVFKTITNPQGTGKTVLLVVGYSPEELGKAVSYLTTKEVRTSIDASYVITVASPNQTIYVGQNCTDSDGGKNYYMNGMMNYTQYGSKFSLIDECALGPPGGNFPVVGECSGDNCYVLENYCSDNLSLEGIDEAYHCPNGCVNGACVNNEEPHECETDWDCGSGITCNSTIGQCILKSINQTCIASDGGITNIYVQGRVYGSLENIGWYTTGPGNQGKYRYSWQNYSLQDYCGATGGQEEGKLVKYSCNNEEGSPEKNFYSCPNGCVNGACVPTCDSGCSLNEKCYPLGYRKSGLYCSENYQFIHQLNEEISCENSFECTSNVCADNKCISGTLIQKILNWFKNLF